MPRPFVLLSLFAAGMLYPASRTCAETANPFETADLSWRLAEADCPARVAAQQRSFQQPHAGQACEHLQIEAGRGTYVYVTHDIDHARVIAELSPSVWVRSDRTGIQLLARVVLPRAEDPRTGRAMTTLIRGTSYDKAGSWQQLQIRDAAQLLARQLVILRSQFGSHIDAREAYLDLLVLNAYGGAGETNLWVDDLEVAGYVSSSVDNPQIGIDTRAPMRWVSLSTAGHEELPSGLAESHVRLQGSVLMAEGRPLLVRMIEHNGESFEWLKALGFNTMKLSAPPTNEQLQEARRLNLWLVAPPPQTAGGGTISAAHDRVLAWNLGQRLAVRDLEAASELAAQVRRSDVLKGRPLVCSADAHLWHYSRIIDLLMTELSPLGTSFELSDFAPWLRERTRLARPGTPFWATVQTELAEELVGQVATLGQDFRLPIGVEPDQIRLLAYNAIAAGARGLCFQSRSRLDARDESTQLRAATLQLMNLELLLLEPWAAAGSLAGEIESTTPGVRVAVLQTDRSRLLLLTRHGAGQQYAIGPYESTPVSFVDPGASLTSQGYTLTPAGLLPLRHGRRDPGGMRITLDEFGLTGLVLLTQDPLVVNHVQRQLTAQGSSVAKLQNEIASRWMTAVEDTQRRLSTPPPNVPVVASLQEASGSLRQAQQLLAAGDNRTSQELAARTNRALAKIRHGYWQHTVAGFPSPAASPFCASFATLPLHWSIAGRLNSGRWNESGMTGGDMEDLPRMQQAGWQHHRHVATPAHSHVELATKAARSGRFGLRLRTWTDDEPSAPSVVEVPPVWISTPPVTVRQGQLVRINGWVHLPSEMAGTRDGLLIFDSIGGLPLAERIRRTGDWQQVTLYRVAPLNGQLTVTFAVTGLGEAWIDEVTVSLLEANEATAAFGPVAR